jgi:hypothetical protein
MSDSDPKQQALHASRQDAITALYRLIDEQQLHIDEPDVSLLDSVIRDLTVYYAGAGVTREEHREIVNDVWHKMCEWLNGE